MQALIMSSQHLGAFTEAPTYLNWPTYRLQPFRRATRRLVASTLPTNPYSTWEASRASGCLESCQVGCQRCRIPGSAVFQITQSGQFCHHLPPPIFIRLPNSPAAATPLHHVCPRSKGAPYSRHLGIATSSNIGLLIAWS
jgi:hypothetical protein